MSPFEKVVIVGRFFAEVIILLSTAYFAIIYTIDTVCRFCGKMTLSGRRKAKEYSEWYFGTADVHFKVKGNFSFAMVGAAVIVFDCEGKVVSLPSDRVRQTDVLKSL